MLRQLCPPLRLHRAAMVLALGITAFVLAGCDEEDLALCVTAVRPFYTEQDLTTDAGLLGTWDVEGEVRFTFTPAENNSYNVIVEEIENDKHATSRFEGHLFRLGADSFLDLFPASVPEGSEFYLLHLFRCHTVAKVDFRGDQLQMRFMNPTWFAEQIKASALTTPHATANDVLLLTGTTQEMQELLFLNANDDSAFGETLGFERARDEEEQ